MEEKEVLEEKTETKDTKALVKKILVIVGNVVFYAIIILLFLFSLMNINAGNGTENFPNLFGKGMLSVETPSMERNGNYTPEEWKDYSIGEIKTGDLVYADVFNGSTSSLKVGDVIIFAGKIYGERALICHRIVYILDDVVVTQGDAVLSEVGPSSRYDLADTERRIELAGETVDGNADKYAQLVSISDVRGIVTGVSSGAGSVLSNIRQNWLFYFVIPVAVILLLEIVFVIKNFLDLRNEKNKASLADDKEAMLAELEAEKEKMRQELLAELKAQQAAQTPTAPEPEVVDEPIEQVEEAQEATDDTTEEVVEENNEEEAKEE